MTRARWPTILATVVELFAISVVFMAVAMLVRRPWTVALPFVVWLGVAGLSEAGILPGGTSLGSALLAGGMGALFAIAGLIVGRRPARNRPRS